MKHLLTTVSTLCIGAALTLTACGKDKKAATTEPATAEPAKSEPAKSEPATAADDKPKGDDAKPAAGGGW
jgi:hypothetical protein